MLTAMRQRAAMVAVLPVGTCVVGLAQIGQEMVKRMFTKRILLYLSILGLLVTGISAYAGSYTCGYTVTDLDSIKISDMNNKGEICGTMYKNGTDLGCVWKNGRVTMLKCLPGGKVGCPVAINDYGTVVGYAFPDSIGACVVVWNSCNKVCVLCPGIPTGINKSGAITGYVQEISTLNPDYTYTKSFIWRCGKMTWLEDDLETCIKAVGIDKWGAALCVTWGLEHPNNTGSSVWWKGSYIPLGNLGYDLCEACALNDKNQVVGTAINSSGDWRAFLWEKDNMYDLGCLGDTFSWAKDINNKCQIVGKAGIGVDSVNHAFLWEKGKMTDLNKMISSKSGWELMEATAINDSGWIAGWGYHNSKERAFLLKPTKKYR